MKQIMRLAFVALGIIFSVAASAQTKANWAEMHAFHGVMSKSFHPAEEGKFDPLKENAASLVSAAKTWQSSTVPAGYNAKVTAPILKQLVKDCQVIEKSVKANASNDVLLKQITKAHDTFHEIMEKCRDEKH